MVWRLEEKNQFSSPYPKKWDVSECKNNRAIALIPHASKIILHIVNERLRPHLERELPPAGFRGGHDTRDHIFATSLKNARNIGERHILCFIDYAKAYDCLGYGPLWIALQALRSPQPYSSTTKKPLWRPIGLCAYCSGDSDWFNLGKGVRQGCIFSPTLFNCRAHHETCSWWMDWRHISRRLAA